MGHTTPPQSPCGPEDSHSMNEDTKGAPEAEIDHQLKQILEDLRVMGERLSVATKKQIEDIKRRTPDPAGKTAWYTAHAASSKVEDGQGQPA
jgi:hypothetical protein